MGVYLFFLGFLVASFPFILPFRGYPNGDFYSDISALVIALVAVAFCFRRFSVGREVLFFIGLAAVFLVSGWFGRGYYYDTWLLPSLALLLGAAFLAGVVASGPSDKDKFFKGCIYGLLAGGGFSLVIGYFQMLGITSYLGALVFPGGKGVYGNIAQRNMFTTYLFFFASAVSWLLAEQRLKCWLAAPCLLLVAYILAFSGSRMVLLNAFFLALLVWVFYLSKQKLPAVERFAVSALGFLICIACFQLVLFYFGEGGASRITLSVDVPRRDEWLKAWFIFLDNPMGVGIGQYAKYSFIYQIDQGVAATQITWTHAHNLLLQFMVEFGVWIIPFIALGVWLFFSFAARCYSAGTKGLMVLSCVVVILSHSLLEYPLWYMSFLFLFFAFIAALGSGGEPKPVVSINLAAVLCLLAVFWVVGAYAKMPGYRLPDKDMRVNIVRMGELLKLSLNPALAWPADKMLTEYLIEEDGPELNFKLCKSIYMAIREPLPPYLERIALFAIAGQDFDLASQVLKSRYAVYPDLPDVYLKSRIGLLWPNDADRFIAKIDSERAAGFPDHDYFRLSVPERCQ